MISYEYIQKVQSLRKVPFYIFSLSTGLVLVLGMVYGFFAYRFHLPPYKFFLSSYLGLHDEIFPSDPLPQPNIHALITIKGADSVAKVRRSLTNILWADTLPARSDVEISTISIEDRYGHFGAAVLSIEQLVVQMEYELDSKMHLFHPVSRNGVLVIYHQGHKGDFLNGSNTIRGLLDEGYSVLACLLYTSDAADE